MSDMPDFDNMTPEEINEWMESLAKRQGATEGLTTDASLDVPEVDESDERLADAGEYIPYGWTRERWEAQLEKEQQEKDARQQQAQQAQDDQRPPEAPPLSPSDPATPQQPAVSTDDSSADEPDVDNMTPEEMMEWMESLAKRQGGDESGFTTSASMQVSDVDPDDERLQGLPEYKPYGMSDEEWERLKAKDEAERQARLDARRQQEPEQAPADTMPPPATADAQPPASTAPGAQASTSMGDDGMPDVDSMTPEEMMEWMESLAKRQGGDESGFTTSASMQVSDVDPDDERLQGLPEYKPYGMSDEEWERLKAKDEAERQARLDARRQQEQEPAPDPFAEASDEELAAASAGDLLDAPNLDDLFSGNNEIPDDDYDDYDDYDEDEDDIAAALDSNVLDAPSFDDIFGGDSDDDAVSAPEEPAAAGDPMAWLQGLDDSADSGDTLPDFDFAALDQLGDDSDGDDDPLGFLSSLGDGDNDMPDFDLDALSGASESDDSTAMPDLGFSLDDMDDDDDEGSPEWLEALARRQGADDDELMTDGSADIPMPDNLEETGPGYTDFSFEDATGMGFDDDDTLDDLDDDDFDLDDLDLESVGDEDDASGWLDAVASGAGKVIDDAEDADDDNNEDDEFDSLKDDVMTRLNSGQDVAPEDIDSFFKAAFRKGLSRDDVPDYIDVDEADADDDVPDAIEAEIPDWLKETMSTAEMEAVDEEAEKRATSEMAAAIFGMDDEDEDDLGLDEEDLPDWLQENAASDTGEIRADIFEEIIEDEDLQAMDEDEMPVTAEELQIDTSDSWVEAFVAEEEKEEELAQWYNQQLQNMGEEASPAPADETPIPEAAPAASLQPADLTMEMELPAGTPMSVPAWMSDDTSTLDNQEVSTVEVDEMDWMSTDETEAVGDDMPDWLRETVDDSVTDETDFAAWMDEEGFEGLEDVDDLDVADIPDWLRETMDEEDIAQISADDDFTLEMDEDDDFAEIALEESDVPAPASSETQVAPPTPTQLPVSAGQSPAPPVPTDIDVAATLEAAQGKVADGNIAAALQDYEAVVRANQSLAVVENDVRQLAEGADYKRNPAIYRILGDVLMRQGKLQEALDTYRRALNML